MTAHPLHATLGSAHGVAFLAVPAVAELAAPDSYMARNSRSFHFAAAFMRRAERERTARVYAWCRFVDDLADATGDPALAEAQLDTWLECSRAAYDVARRPLRSASPVSAGIRRHAPSPANRQPW